MKYEHFGRHYRDFKREGLREPLAIDTDIPAEEAGLLTEAAHWDSFFGKLTIQHLTGERINVDKKLTRLDEYNQWAASAIPEIENNTVRFVELHPTHSGRLSVLNFHFMASNVMEQWRMLIDPSYTPTDREVELSQSRLELTALRLVDLRHKLHEYELQAGQKLGVVGAIYGQLTEIDGFVANLKASRDHPAFNLVQLPAAKKFEDADNKTNIDLLTLDRDSGEAHGWQLKTNITYGAADQIRRARYDPRFVTVLSGIDDLKNFRLVRNNLLNTIEKRSSPGKLSAEHIQGITYPQLMSLLDKNEPLLEFNEIIAKAHRITDNQKSTLDDVAKDLWLKMLEGLSDDPESRTHD